MILIVQCQSTGNLADVSKALASLLSVAELTPEHYPSFPHLLNNLGIAYKFRFELTGDLHDLSKAVSACARAVELTPDGHSHMPSHLTNLGVSLNCRFQRAGDLHDLDQAIVHQKRAIQLTPDGDSEMASRYSNLGVYYSARALRNGDLHDLSEAILMKQQAVNVTPEQDPVMFRLMNNLGISLKDRFKRTGDLQDLTLGISAARKAVELAPKDHQMMHFSLDNLGIALNSRFSRTGEILDIDDAISAQRKAVELTPKGHPETHLHLSHLGSSLQARFRCTENHNDIADAIIAQERALEVTPPGHPWTASWLNNLAMSFTSRFQHTGDLAYLAQAISTEQRALKLTPENHPDYASRLNSLASSLRDRFECTGDFDDITEAISLQKKVIDLNATGNPSMHVYLGNFASSLRSRFKRTGDLHDLNEAISALQKAVAFMTTADNLVQMDTHLSHLGTSLVARFRRTANSADLDEAISVQRRAVTITPEGHVNMPFHLNNLGATLESRFHHRGSSRDFDEAIANLKASATNKYSPPRSRVSAAKNWAELLNHSYPPPPDILEAFEVAIDLSVLAVTLDLTLERRYGQLQKTPNLPLQAASAAFLFDKPGRALEWLEQGRCLVWGQLTNLRAPLDDLWEHDAHLADRIMEVSKQLDRANGSSSRLSREGMSLSEKVSLENQSRNQMTLAREWDDLLASVRVLPGFETFLKPSPWYTLLQHLPDSGPVVVINIDVNRCDAIALVPGKVDPLHIPLPLFSLAKCTKYREDLNAQLRSFSETRSGERSARSVTRVRHSETIVQAILRRLWEKLVKPILQKLDINNTSSATTLPRIWWCPTGSLSFLPIHAAGRYGNEESECLMDYAVSSYTPTVAALIERVKNVRSIDRATSGLFITSQPDAPGCSSIQGTTKEVRSIHDLLLTSGARAEKAEGSAATISATLEAMDAFTSIHLACHASQDAADPLKSRFHFHNGTLDLATIIQRNLKNADLAFLSACQTSTGVEKLSDEAVHLAAGMLAAGYCRVVATMWSIEDRHAPGVAIDFYQYLLNHADKANTSSSYSRGPSGGSGFDGTNSARALHHAIQRLRTVLADDSDHSLLAWVPYVHYGY
ncbi:CHAT domain-containing protein [Ephemerocybe angulata]|uniref:CHAT domain-containing protein n=1 Tax=Ephemerocybe angulata TaxID=980116 RepID=A0A8H6LYL5_9AGAR|nr:CHAT domain-containing protein [Tulosesus angulatus]